MKKALTKGVLRNQILDEGGAEVNNDFLKIIPLLQKKAIRFSNWESWAKSYGSGNKINRENPHDGPFQKS